MISILLASYNGERFISEQLDSLLGQTVQDFKIIICDDRSTDSTLSIIQDYAEKYAGKIFVEQNKKNMNGAKQNFMKMMIEHKDDYVMLCDQDDVWLPDKIEKTLSKLREMENLYGKQTPILVHTNLNVVDNKLNTIYTSYFESINYRFSDPPLNYLLVQNTVAGCTAMYNRALAEMFFAEPEYFFMHDWWLALTARILGKLGTICEPLILYRQHENNEIGAKKKSLMHRLFNINETMDAINNTYRQASSLLDMYSDKISEEHKQLLEDFSLMPQMPRCRRLKMFFKCKTFKIDLWRKAAQVFMIIMMK